MGRPVGGEHGGGNASAARPGDPEKRCLAVVAAHGAFAFGKYRARPAVL